MDTFIGFLATIIQGIGAQVIGLSVGRAILVYLWSFAASHGELRDLEPIRLDLGRGLVLGLEFLIGADILRSILAPTWQEIAVLAAIIAIRTALSLSIEFELSRAQSRGSYERQSS